MCWQRKIIVKAHFHAAVICCISKASWLGLSSYEPNCSILTLFSEANQTPAHESKKYKINTTCECGHPLHNVFQLKICIHKWSSHPIDKKGDLYPPVNNVPHGHCACRFARTHTSCIHHGVLFLNQVEPCQRVVSTSWCTSDGAGCDVGSANGCSQDAACSHTMGALNYPVRHTDRQENPACQLVEQWASRYKGTWDVTLSGRHVATTTERAKLGWLRLCMTRIVKNDDYAGGRFQRISLQ